MPDTIRGRAFSAIAATVLVGIALFTSACFERAPTQDQREPLAEPSDPVVPVFDQPFDHTWLDMRSPIRLASAPGGKLLVSDSRWHVVLRVDEESRTADQAFLVDGKPLAVGMRGDQIFVGNATTNTVDVFGASGGFSYSFGDGAAPYPTDLAIDDALGLVFVVAGGTRDVKVFSLSGELQGTITGSGGARLQSPTGIAVDEGRREVLVSDYGAVGGHASVKIFDYDGSLVGEITGGTDCGVTGCSGGFSRPQGLAVDGTGLIYLADALLGQVLVLDRASGEAVAMLGAHASDGGDLRLPMDVVLGGRGEPYVASNGTASVEVVR
jgi:DNA-binding beta-propeller fold protein YncE